MDTMCIRRLKVCARCRNWCRTMRMTKLRGGHIHRWVRLLIYGVPSILLVAVLYTLAKEPQLVTTKLQRISTNLLQASKIELPSNRSTAWVKAQEHAQAHAWVQQAHESQQLNTSAVLRGSLVETATALRSDTHKRGETTRSTTRSQYQHRRNKTHAQLNSIQSETSKLTKENPVKQPTTEDRPASVNLTAWKAALHQHASVDKIIILALVDSAFLDMTLNFYETSIKKFGIDNYLFIASDEEACIQLLNRTISCHVYMMDAAAGKATLYGSKEFNRKMNIRTFMILDALRLGYHVMHTDIDIVFLKNPLQDIVCNTSSCDLAALWDSFAWNAGFLFVRASPGSIEVYKKMEHTALHTKYDDQTALNGAIRQLKGTVKAQKLDENKYMCGLNYFEKGHRMFAGQNPCEKCVVVHNNWIVSREAKTYRQRETHLWVYDGEQYYSSTKRKYLLYDNPHVFASKAEQVYEEKVCLVAALAIAHILNRIVILPKFHCDNKGGKMCPLNSFYKISAFDTIFANKYRESSFLAHSKVPDSVKYSLSDVFFIHSEEGDKYLKSDPSSQGKISRMMMSMDQSMGATSEEIKEWFGKEKSHVLRFYSLYSAFSKFSNATQQSEFTNMIKHAFSTAKYRQL